MRIPCARISRFLPVAVAAMLLASAALAAAAWAPAAWADDDDQDEARAAVERGEILPLADILDRVQPELPGRVLGVELEREDGVWIYELKILRDDGRRVEVEVDAATAAVLSRDED